MTLNKKYKELKTKKKEDLSKEDKIILNAFKYEVFKKSPDKEYKNNFKEIFEADYPDKVEDISEDLYKNLKRCIKARKKAKKAEEKYTKQRAEKGYCDLDIFSPRDWFLKYAPLILQEMRDDLHGNPVFLANGAAVAVNQCDNQKVNMPDEEESPDFKKWKEILDEMIFLLKEMDEETCTFENRYEEEYMTTLDDFITKYGFAGDKLKSDEEKEEERKRGSARMYGPSDFPDLYPDFNELSCKHMMMKLTKDAYREKCKNRFFHMFSEYFWDLWD